MKILDMLCNIQDVPPQVIEITISKGARVNDVDDLTSATCIWNLCNNGKGSPAILRVLLNHGGNPCIPNKDGMTPILAACLRGSKPEIVTLLLQGGADQYICCHGMMPLNEARKGNHTELVKILTDPPVFDPKMFPLISPRDIPPYTTVQIECMVNRMWLLIQQKRWGDAILCLPHVTKDELKYTDSGKQNVIFLACFENAPPEIIKGLIDKGGDVHARNMNGWTPLMAACYQGASSDVVRVLLAAGSDVNAQEGVNNNENKEGNTALMFACMNTKPSLELIAVLLAAGADPKQKINGISALEMADANENSALVKVLSA
jgi:ankyrin repeat protein